MRSLTALQLRIVRLVKATRQRTGEGPTIDELAARTGAPHTTVQGAVDSLRLRGLLVRVPGAARGLDVAAPPPAEET